MEKSCLCCALGMFEALEAWQQRAKPVVSRLIRNGHRVNAARMCRTTDLVTGLERGVWSPDDAAHSHHMLWCPARCGGARIPMPPLQSFHPLGG